MPLVGFITKKDIKIQRIITLIWLRFELTNLMIYLFNS